MADRTAQAHSPAQSAARARAWVRELRPSVVTGGASAAPLLLLFGINAVDELDRSAFNVLLPEVRDWFGVSLQTVLAATSISTLLGIAIVVPLGYFADRWRRTWMVATGAVLWGVCSILTGLAPTLVLLFAARLGSGIGRTLEPAQQSLLADSYAPEVRAGVFSVHKLADSVGRMIGPLGAGLLASLFFWQLPFFVFAVPTFALVYFLLRMREPVRGEQERRAQGASEEVALTAEKPPSLTESWRLARNVRTLRRIWLALPFFLGAAQTLLALLPLFYDEVFDVGPAGRGAIAAFDEPFSIAGLVIGGVIANRLLRRRPGRVLAFSGLLLVASSLSLIIAALSPWLSLAIAISYTRAFAFAILAPAATAVITLVVPPRARGFALSVGALFLIPGVLYGPFVSGPLADTYGLRVGLLSVVPVLLIGAVILMSSASGVEPDMRQAQAAAMAAHRSAEAKAEGDAKLLVVRDLDLHYDGVQVLFNVDFEVTEGEIIALLGTNGAGKSTLLRAISGVSEPSNGAIFFDGDDITHLPASAHAARGIIQVPGGKGVFPTLSVAENLRLAAWLFRRDQDYVRTATDQVLGYFPVLSDRLAEPAGNLSGGEQQMLTLGQAFLSRPRLLMIDELSLGLAPAVVEQLLGIVRAIAEQGTTVILVEQSVNIALTLAEKAVFMEKGEIVFTGSTAELIGRPDILRSVFLKGSASGRGSFGSRRRRTPGLLSADGPAAVLEVRGLSKSYGGITAINGVDLVLREGETLGLIGPNGAGKTTLFDLISGYLAPDEGSVLLFGEDITGTGPDGRALLGLHRSFQDARLFPALTVEENIAVALDRHLEVHSSAAAALRLPNVGRAERRLAQRADRLIRLMNLDAFRDKFVRELSTGTRRVVDLACVLAADPKVLLLDEPSSGVAQRETEELGPLLQRIKYETGCSVLIIEHDMPLISAVSDELVALDLGAVVTRGRPDEVLDHPKVVESYLGTTADVIQRSG